MAFLRVARASELQDGQMRAVHAGGRRILLLKVGETLAAYEDRCAHLGVALSGGRLDAGVLTCGAHHWQYDAATGRGINPRGATLARVALRIVGDEIQVEVEPAA
jgi:toluene monooxygenase system ferredoxin subunit